MRSVCNLLLTSSFDDDWDSPTGFVATTLISALSSIAILLKRHENRTWFASLVVVNLILPPSRNSLPFLKLGKTRRILCWTDIHTHFLRNNDKRRLCSNSLFIINLEIIFVKWQNRPLTKSELGVVCHWLHNQNWHRRLQQLFDQRALWWKQEATISLEHE